MKRRTFFLCLLGVLFFVGLVSLASCHNVVVPRLGVLGYDDGRTADLNVGTYDTVWRVGNRWFFNGDEVTDGWFATVAFNNASALGLNFLVVCLLLFAPGIALLVITKNNMTFFIGIFVGVAFGYLFLPNYFPVWMVFAVVLANVGIMWAMIKR